MSEEQRCTEARQAEGGGEGEGEGRLPSQSQTSVFFPVDFLKASSGWLLGWRVGSGDSPEVSAAFVFGALIPAMPVSLALLFVRDINDRLVNPEGEASVRGLSHAQDDGSHYESKRLDLHFKVLPQKVELLGWWRGSAQDAKCPYASELKEEKLLIELRLEKELPVCVGGLAGLDADFFPRFVFLFELPKNATLSVLATAPFDLAQAVASSPFTLNAERTQLLLRHASLSDLDQGRTFAAPGETVDAAEFKTTFEVALHLLNFSACLALSASQQTSFWRECRKLQLRQTPVASHRGRVSSSSKKAENTRRDDAVLRSVNEFGCCGVQTAPRRVFSRVSALCGAMCVSLIHLFISLSGLAARCVGMLLFCGRSFEEGERESVESSPTARSCRLFSSAFWDQVKLRVRCLSLAPAAIVRVRVLTGAAAEVCAAERKELLRQTEVREEALRSGLADSSLLAHSTDSATLRLRRGQRRRRFFLPSLVAYGAVATLLFDATLGFWLPHAVAALVAAFVPNASCASSPSQLHFQNTGTSRNGAASAALADARAAVELLVLPRRDLSEVGEDSPPARGDLIDFQILELKRRWMKVSEANGRVGKEVAMSDSSGDKEEEGSSSVSEFNFNLQFKRRPSALILGDIFSRGFWMLHAKLLSSHVRWLMENPAGIKLNPNVSRLLGSVILTVMEVANGLALYVESALLLADRPNPTLRFSSVIAALARQTTRRMWKRGTQGTFKTQDLPQEKSSSASTKKEEKEKEQEEQEEEKEQEEEGLETLHLLFKTEVGRALGLLQLLCSGPSAAVFLGAAADLLRVSTLHIFYVYVVCARLLHFNLRSLYSLFLFFRGKKLNVLRRRIDSVTLEVDQLLLGCLLFTVALCIFPTVLIFYLSYLFIWLFIFTVQALFRMALLFVCSCPLYLLVCRLTDPDLLPTKVRLRPLNSAEKQAESKEAPLQKSCFHFFVQPMPVPLTDVLRPALQAAAAATLSPLKPRVLLARATRGNIIGFS